MFKFKMIETPLGKMYAVADDQTLHYLGFEEGDFVTTLGITKPLEMIQEELNQYFFGNLTAFQTPLYFQGSPFQIDVWNALRTIPFGKTKSYKEVASMIQNPKACRAVGLANGKNPFVIIVPCHRVIQADGSLGGYSAGLYRKKWLLEHEFE
jgi:AraC family transcriptional regulator, regulatory protein of adaptative response / methylated-DNA-[protein]-cysteine methyltransferase